MARFKSGGAFVSMLEATCWPGPSGPAAVGRWHWCGRWCLRCLADALALRRRHHDGDHGEEAHPVSRDQSAAAAGEEPLQTGQHAHPAQLEEEAAAAILCPAHCHAPRTLHGVLGYGHLRHTHTWWNSHQATPTTLTPHFFDSATTTLNKQ